MSRDFGGGKRRSKGIGIPAIIVGALLLVVAVLVGSRLAQRPRDIRKAEEWAISGPPCPQLSAPAFQAQPVRIHERSEVDDISFGRGYGHMSCDDIVNDGGRGFGTFTECQFSSPGAIEVTTTAGDSYFLTRVSPATVTVKKGVVGCVLAARFRGEQSVPGD